MLKTGLQKYAPKNISGKISCYFISRINALNLNWRSKCSKHFSVLKKSLIKSNRSLLVWARTAGSLLAFALNNGVKVSGHDQFHTSNLLLGALTADDRVLLEPHLVRVALEREQTLAEPDQPIDYVYFLEQGVASVVSETGATGPTEVAIFGFEGVSGLSAILGARASRNRTFMQIGGGEGAVALRIALPALQTAMRQSPTLMAILLCYVHTTMVQLSHAVVSNAHHRLEARLARWLLMCHDRIPDNDIALTHRFMSMMVTAQRPGVTVALHIFEGSGAIRSTRGKVTITDRRQLERIAGDAYGAPEAEYRRLIAPFGRSA